VREDGRVVEKSGARVRPELVVHLRRARDHADRHFDEPLDLAQLAAVAALSPWYFQRLFTATYGMSPAAHLSQRRVERAADLLRSGELTVTEVCLLVGFTSLGSFSSRFRELVGESPSVYQQRWSAGPPRVPGCWLFMAGLGAAKVDGSEPADRASEEKHNRSDAP
jgi:AraC-like DNA-binding protein